MGRTLNRTQVVPSNTAYIRIDCWKDNINTMQIEPGSKANSYTPFGTTPIEYCKIGNYEDEFVKPSGKNLFDKDDVTIISNKFINFDNSLYQYKSDGSNNRNYVVILNIEPNTTYTISKILTSRFAVGTSQNKPHTDDYFNVGSQQNGSTSITIKSGANDHYLTIWFIRTDLDTPLTIQQVLDSMMVEKNTTATTYEPYGSDKWWLRKRIGKIVFDGSENWGKSSKAQVNRYYVGNIFNTILNVSSIDLISNYFVCITQNQSDSNNIGLAKYNENGLMVNFGLTDTDFDTLAKFKAWLSEHNTIVYYVLATPTYIPLNDTLQTQLDNIQKAISYQGQTNISQENNDLPFTLKFSAIRDLSGIFELISQSEEI